MPTSYNVLPSCSSSFISGGGSCPMLLSAPCVTIQSAGEAEEGKGTHRSYAAFHSSSRRSFASSTAFWEMKRAPMDPEARAERDCVSMLSMAASVEVGDGEMSRMELNDNISGLAATEANCWGLHSTTWRGC